MPTLRSESKYIYSFFLVGQKRINTKEYWNKSVYSEWGMSENDEYNYIKNNQWKENPFQTWSSLAIYLFICNL